MNVCVASTETEIAACFPVMHELRPHLEENEFVSRVQRQMQNHGYTLTYLAASGRIVAVAGYRVIETLSWGRTLYVDDLATLSSARKQGYGGRLLDSLMQTARDLSCVQFHLDSGMHRHDAHRLYLNHGLQINALHFSAALKPETA
ncbi:MAG TPA: GNAT family N-acetyltransferase [Burkholderiales bacterium]|nr:GNAT family N-acetyltransferase [Burkholderiales bacterium]